MAFSLGFLFAMAYAAITGFIDFLAGKITKHTKCNPALAMNLSLFILFILFLLTQGKSFQLPFDLLPLAVATGIASFLSLYFFYRGIAIEKVSIISALSSTYPLYSTIIAIALFKEAPGILTLAAGATIVFGTLLISIDYNEIKKLKVSKGAVLAILSGVASGFTGAFLQPLALKLGTIETALVVTAIATIGLLLTEKHESVKVMMSKKNVKMFAAFVILVTGGWVTYLLALENGLVSIVAPVSATSPLITLALAYAFLKERLHKIQLLGFIVTILGLVLIAL